MSREQTVAVVLSVGLGVVVAGYGLIGSYLSVAELADRHNVPLAWLVPAGIDGGLVAVVVLDLVLTWIGSPVGWVRQLVRVLSVGTVLANAVAGWPVHSGLVGLLGAEDASLVYEQLRDKHELARRRDLLLAARDTSTVIDESPLLAQLYRNTLYTLTQQCPDGYAGQFGCDVDRLLLILLRFVDARLQETQGFRGDASKYLRKLGKSDERPLEKELGRDLRDFLLGQGIRAHLEISNVGGGRVDVAWKPHDEILTIELKRDWDDVSWGALERTYLPQVVAYQTGGPPLNFFMVLDLTEKPSGLAALPACVTVRTVPGPAEDPRVRTVIMLRVQGNKPDPSALKTT